MHVVAMVTVIVIDDGVGELVVVVHSVRDHPGGVGVVGGVRFVSWVVVVRFD